MPADADFLCEYFIASSFQTKSKLANDSTSTLNKKLAQINSTYSENSNNNNNTSHYFDSIDFVKYDKNPMDFLKSKYTLLNSNQKQQNQTNNNINNCNNGSNNASSSSTVDNHQSSNKSPTTNKVSLDLNWSKIKKIGIGLLNLGNNCYLNATLQCLAYTPPLSQWLVQRAHSPACRFKQAKGFCSLCEVERIVSDIFSSTNGCAKPNTLCFNIKKISHVFGVGTQEDASEFFTTLLESMSKSIKFSLHHAMKFSGGDGSGSGSKISNEKNKKMYTIFDDIFSFQFRSRITCCNCGRLSDTIENTNTWPVDVKYTQDIRKAMLHFLREEVLDGENAYKCEKCNRKVRATKKYSIRTAPNVLVIHLKRFDFSYAGKLSHYVSYPETLSLKTLQQSDVAAQAPQTSDEKSAYNVSYKLYGVLVHLGHTSHSGHYYSYVRGPNEQWYKADDTRISSVQTNDALNQNAYILFYSKMQNNTDSHMQTCKTFANDEQKSKPNNIPHLIGASSSSVPNTSNNNNNYLNSLMSRAQFVNQAKPTMIDSNHQKIVIKLNNNNNSNLIRKNVHDLGEKLDKAEAEKLKTNDNEKREKKEKNTTKLTKIKKLKRLIKRLSAQVQAEHCSLSVEEKQQTLIKLKLKKKKLKKLKKLKKAKKEELNKSKRKIENEANSDDESLRNKKKKTKKQKLSNADGLSLLRQVYNDEEDEGDEHEKRRTPSPHAPQKSKSPSPTHSHTSLSSMSSATSISLTLKESSGNDSSASSAAETQSTTTISLSKKSQISDPIFKFNPCSKLPSKLSGGQHDASTNAASSANTSVFDRINEKCSLHQVKTWSNEKSALGQPTTTNGHGHSNYDDMDDYNEEFDRPRERKLTKQQKLKRLGSSLEHSGFHMFTHGHSKNGHKMSHHNHQHSHYHHHRHHHHHRSHHNNNNYNNNNNNNRHHQNQNNGYNGKKKPFNAFHRR